jgi:hypothetical protein
MGAGTSQLTVFRENPRDDTCADCLHRHTVCGLEIFTGDDSQKHRYSADFVLSGSCVTVTGRRVIEGRIAGFLCRRFRHSLVGY